MFHVDNSTGVPVMPQPSPVTSEAELFFTEGGNGVPPTYPGPDWFNIIQSELLNIVRTAGISPDKMDSTQLLAALGRLFLKRNNPFGDIAQDGPEAIATALSNLGLGTAAQRNIGTGTSNISDNSYFTLSGNATSGVMHFPNNFKINWGGFALSAGGASTKVVTFYEAFTSGVIIVIPIPSNSAGATNQIGYASASTTQATIQKGSGDSSLRSGVYLAVGI